MVSPPWYNGDDPSFGHIPQRALEAILIQDAVDHDRLFKELLETFFKLEFMRMLTRLRLDPARMTLLAGFFETYLKLNADEEQALENELRKLNAEEV